MLSWLLFKHYLFSRRSGALIKVIAWISIVSVTLGISSLIVVTSVMNGFNQTIRKRMFGIEPHLVVLAENEKNPKQVKDFLKLQERVESKFGDHVSSLAYVESQDVIIRTFEGLFGGGVAKGYTASDLNGLLMRIFRYSQSPTSEPVPESEFRPVDLGEMEVAIGMDLARELEIFQGDQVLLIPPEALLLGPGEAPSYQKVMVKEILSTRLSDFDSKTILYNRQIGLPFLRKSLSKQFQLDVRFQKADFAIEASESQVFESYSVESWRDRNRVLFFALKLEKIAMTTFLSMAVAITGFSIISVLALLIAQKKFDYGLFLAMGYSEEDCQKLFSRIGMILSGIGIIVGAVIGTGIATYLQFYPLDILPGIYYDSTIPAQVSPRGIILLLALSATLAWLGTGWPVRKLAGLSPAHILRRG